jgi:hypothetical protein
MDVDPKAAGSLADSETWIDAVTASLATIPVLPRLGSVTLALPTVLPDMPTFAFRDGQDAYLASIRRCLDYIRWDLFA